FLYEWYFFRDLDLQWLKKNSWWPLGMALILAGVALLYLEFTPMVKALSEYQAASLTLAQRFMTQFRIVIFYLFLFLFPHPARLNLDHHFPLSFSLLDPPTTLLSILAVFAILASAAVIARRYRFLSFGILWFMGNLVIEASVPGLDMVFEHRTYLPSILISMILVMFLYQFVARIWARRAVLLIFVAVGAVWTHDRNIIWADNIALWSDSVKKSPQKARPYVNLGIAYGGLDRFDESIFFLDRAVKLKPDYKKPRYNLALSLVARGDYRRGDYSRAERHAREFLDQSPDDPAALNILALALANQNRFEEALDNYYRSLQLEPDDEYVHFYISQILAHIGRVSEAVKHCTEALRLKPDYSEARLHLQQIRRRMEPRKLRIEKPFGD
ncbi:MAG: tetratricopeptide repeat protein, partial [Desulfurivibrionaceae bacterium]